ncbi:hypothetical protein H4Q26_015766 [Puccinia striiformis f. sp. tritici PST-130]|nr:hypothetical protein H4Q26_015766 [Puccinia striiformis f. sp. tritici PST-130]
MTVVFYILKIILRSLQDASQKHSPHFHLGRLGACRTCVGRPLPSADIAASTPATHEKEATPAAASGSTGNVAEKNGSSAQTADAAGHGDKAEQTAQAVSQLNAATTDSTDGAAPHAVAHEKRDEHAPDAATPHDVQQLNATPASSDSGSETLTPTLKKREEHATSEGTPATPHDVQQLNATPASSDSGSETPNTNPHKKREEHALRRLISDTHDVQQLNATPASSDSGSETPNTNPHKKREEHPAPEGTPATPHDVQQLNATPASSDSGSEPLTPTLTRSERNTPLRRAHQRKPIPNRPQVSDPKGLEVNPSLQPLLKPFVIPLAEGDGAVNLVNKREFIDHHPHQACKTMHSAEHTRTIGTPSSTSRSNTPSTFHQLSSYQQLKRTTSKLFRSLTPTPPAVSPTAQHHSQPIHLLYNEPPPSANPSRWRLLNRLRNRNHASPIIPTTTTTNTEPLPSKLLKTKISPFRSLESKNLSHHNRICSTSKSLNNINLNWIESQQQEQHQTQ